MNDAPKQFMDASIDGNAALDTDGDGIKDDVDNCRTKANPTQDNEDGDAFGDVCDPCPPYADNTDTDGDGVGDLCDPVPTSMGDVITLFDGFNYAQAPANVVRSPSAAWTFPIGQVRLANLGGNQRAYYVYPQQGNGQNQIDIVTASYQISQTPSSSPAGVGLVQRFDTGQVVGVGCMIGTGIDGIPHIKMMVTTDEASAINGQSPFNNGQNVAMYFRRTGNQFDCRDMTSSGAASGTQGIVVPTASVGLYSQGTQADFNWIMVVSRP